MSGQVSQASGRVMVAPVVLARLVGLALSEVPGVARAGRPPRSSLLSATVSGGVAVRPSEHGATIDCYVIARPDTNLLELGATIQATVAAVCRELAGAPAGEVNVYIQDVETGRG